MISAERSLPVSVDIPPAARELLTLLRTQIAEEELKMRRAMDRAGDRREAERIWRDFNVAVRPLHDEVQHIVRQLAVIHTARLPIVIQISA